MAKASVDSKQDEIMWGRGAEGASPGLSNPEMPHTVTLPELGQQSVKFFMCYYPKHLLLGRVLVWRNLTLGLR